MRIGIFFGGPSRERELSFSGGRAVYDNLDRGLFEPVPIFVDSLCHFILLDWQNLYQHSIRDFYPAAEYLPPSPHGFKVYLESLGELPPAEMEAIMRKAGRPISREELPQLIDMAFLALHGYYGEDGAIQQELDNLGIPYTGSGPKASKTGIDRSIQKDLMSVLGFPSTKSYTLTREEWLDARAGDIYQEAIAQVGFPMAVQPARQGASIGLTVVEERSGLEGFELAVNRAFFREILPAVEWKDRNEYERIEYLELLADIWDGLGFPIDATFQGQTQTVYHPEALLALLDSHATSAGEGDVFFLESLRREEKIVLEAPVRGKAFSCIVLRRENGEALALPPTELTKASGILDNRAKYLPGLAHQQIPIALPTEQINVIRAACERLFDEMGLQAYARIDGTFSADGQAYLNGPKTTAFLFSSSFFYQQAAAIGLNSTQLLTYIIRISLQERLAVSPGQERYQELLEQLNRQIQETRQRAADKKRIGLIFGGSTPERHLSVESGRNIFEKLAGSESYDPIPLFLSGQAGAYRLHQIPVGLLLRNNADEIRSSIDNPGAHRALTEIRAQGEDITAYYGPAFPIFEPVAIPFEELPQMVDGIFLALLGAPGNGGIQEQLDALGLPYNGPTAQGARLLSNKYQALQTLKRNGVTVANQVLLHKRDYEAGAEAFFRRVETQLDYPIVGKPAEGGASSAVKVLRSRKELEAYTRLAFRPIQEEGMEARRIMRLKSKEEFPPQEDILFESLITAGGASVFLECTAGLLAHNQPDGSLHYDIFAPTENVSSGHFLSPEEQFLARSNAPVRAARFSRQQEEQQAILGRVKKRMEQAARILNVRGCATIDAFVRVFEDRSIQLIPIEINGLPDLSGASSLFPQAAGQGLRPYELIGDILASALQPEEVTAAVSESEPAAVPETPAFTMPLARAEGGQRRQEPIIQYRTNTNMEETSPGRDGGFRPQPFGAYFAGKVREIAWEAWLFLKSPIFLRNFGGLAGAILLLFMLVTGFMRLYTRHGESLQVPNYVGMDLEDALRKARKQDFKIVVIDSFFDSNQEPNAIYQQDPKPLQRAKEGRTIYVSKYRVTPDSIILPTLISAGYNYDQYSIKLKRLDIMPVIKERVFDNKQEENSILYFFHHGRKITDEMLRHGVKVPKGSTLEFVITERITSDVPIPDLICKRYDAAAFLISGSNLVIGNIYGDVADRESAYVYRQEPEYVPGQMIPQGQQVNLYLTASKPSGCPEEEDTGLLDDGGGGGQDEDFDSNN
ncbi:MAG: PASTA domain-containing protein [Lewinellaceae bacterium]|nr:PASTA domain-containing protein [Lewinellaceae bacterium]